MTRCLRFSGQALDGLGQTQVPCGCKPLEMLQYESDHPWVVTPEVQMVSVEK